MPIRLAARAVIVEAERLLLVNAYPGAQSDLWCAPGGGAEPQSSLPENLMREVYEETGLRISVGAPCLVNEFHDPARDFHQVEVFFRCTVAEGLLDPAWQDPEGIVNRRRWVGARELAKLRIKPASLGQIAFGGGFGYDPLERIIP